MMTTLDKEVVSCLQRLYYYVIIIVTGTGMHYNQYILITYTTAGDAGNAVQTNLSKMRFHPDYYRANAYQGLIYDPMSMEKLNYHF